MIVGDLLGYLRLRKKYWLIPVILILLIISFLLFMTAGLAVSPLIYTLF